MACLGKKQGRRGGKRQEKKTNNSFMSHVITKSSEVQVEFSGLVGIVFKKATKDLNVKNHQQKSQKTSE